MQLDVREDARLAALEALNLIGDTSFDDLDLDAITRVAARLFNVPFAFVTLVDHSTVWIKGAYGADTAHIVRLHAFCNETVRLADGVALVVPDARCDERFADIPLVTCDPRIRFYAGVPILVEGCHKVGTLCIMDQAPRPNFGPEEIQELQNLATIVDAQLGLHQCRVHREAETQERGRVEALLNDREAEFDTISKVQTIAETIGNFGLWRIDLEAWTIMWSEGIARIFDRPVPPSRVLDMDVYIGFYHPDDRASVRRRILDAKAGRHLGENGHYRGHGRLFRPSGEMREMVVQGVAERDGLGRVVSLYGVLMDTTDLNRSEQQAKATSDLLRTTLENMDQGLVMLGPDGRVRIHNHRARDLLGLPKNLLFDGASFADIRRFQNARDEFQHAPQDVRGALAENGLETQPLTHERKRPDGTFLEVRTVPLTGGGVVRTYTDITQRRSIEHAVQESERRFRLLAENTTDVVIWSDLDSTRRYVSPAAKAVLGYESEELVGTKPAAFVHPDDVTEFKRVLQNIALTEVDHATSCQRFRRKDGTWVWIEASISLTRDANGTATGYVASLRDISDRKAVEDALRFSQEQLALALDSGSDGFFDLDLVTGGVRFSGPWLSIIGYEDGDVEPNVSAWATLTHPDDLVRSHKLLLEHLKGVSAKFECEYRIRTKSGRYVWMLARGKVVSRSEKGWALRMVGTHIDITQRKEAEQLIAHMAVHDSLTGLPNRSLFRDRLELELRKAERENGTFGILACDLDGFKTVNDTLGHSAGDLLLRTVSERLKAVARDTDLVARLGGDEFAIILGRLDGEFGARSVAQRMIEALEEPIQIDGRVVSVGISIGIAIGPRDGWTVDHLFKNADIALYRAKAEGRNTYRFFETGMDALVAERNTLVNDMREAVRHNGFTLHFQPIVNIASDRIVGFEALLRWRHPTRGNVLPADFIPLAEETGLIVALGDWALLEACCAATAWPSWMRIAVNVSTVQFFRPDDLKRSVLAALKRSGLPPDRLELEITESVLMHDAEAVIACLHSLRDLGIRIALDDFGTGFSSLNYLRRFPFNKIKIDRSFVREILNPDTVAIVRAVVGLGARVGADITAEGVETSDQLARVACEGCTEAQGYLFSKPLSAEDVAELIKDKLSNVAA